MVFFARGRFGWRNREGLRNIIISMRRHVSREAGQAVLISLLCQFYPRSWRTRQVHARHISKNEIGVQIDEPE